MKKHPITSRRPQMEHALVSQSAPRCRAAGLCTQLTPGYLPRWTSNRRVSISMWKDIRSV